MAELIWKIREIKWMSIRALARIFYGRPADKMKVVAVTGTNGKTTTVTILYEVAQGLGMKAGLISTPGIWAGGEELHLNRKMPTTPGPFMLAKIFSAMAERGCEYVFMEASSHALDQGRVAGMNFVGAIFTNLTLDHLDYHKTFENYFGAKKKLFDNLSPGAFALSNLDDEAGEKILANTRAKKYFYSLKKPADFSGKILTLALEGIEFEANGTKIKSKLVGHFNAYNLLSAFSTAKLLGWDLEKVIPILEAAPPPPGRMEKILSPRGVLAIVDYAHSPDSLEKALRATRELCQPNRKVITVFGCGGDPDPEKRRQMGKLGTTLADLAIFTADNPRYETETKVIGQMKKDLSPEDLQKVKVFWDRREAIRKAVELAHNGDIILAAGKGHENYQDIRGTKEPYNEMEELKKALAL